MLENHNKSCQCDRVSPAGSKFCNHCGQPLSKTIGVNSTSINQMPQPTHQNNVCKDSPLIAPSKLDATQTNRTTISQTTHCSGCGQRFQPGQYVCDHCNYVKPLSPDHYIAPEAFQWSMDGQAMAKLRSITPLNAVANQVSKQVGRPWIEANFNGVRLSSRQMPKVYAMAVQAARVLGLRQMPSIYVSGHRPWDAMTFGSNDDAFIVMGSALVSCFEKGDLMFLFAREMGHVLAGHALWKTVIQFCLGEQNSSNNMTKNGIAGLLDPFKLLESAVELPLAAWARQAEITADRAGLLASGGLQQARKTLMMWSLRSPVLYRQINIDAWLEQQTEDTENNQIRLAEAVSSTTPYLTRRLKLLQDFDSERSVRTLRQKIKSLYIAEQSRNKLEKEAESVEPEAQKENRKSLQCPACQKQVSVPADLSENKSQFAFRCPNQQCQKVFRVSPPKSNMQPEPLKNKRRPERESNETISQMIG